MVGEQQSKRAPGQVQTWRLSLPFWLHACQFTAWRHGPCSVLRGFGDSLQYCAEGLPNPYPAAPWLHIPNIFWTGLSCAYKNMHNCGWGHNQVQVHQQGAPKLPTQTLTIQTFLWSSGSAHAYCPANHRSNKSDTYYYMGSILFDDVVLLATNTVGLTGKCVCLMAFVQMSF